MGEVSVMATSPRSSVNVFPETSRMDLHPADGSIDPKLHGSLLLAPHAVRSPHCQFLKRS